ncbi:hypothetical protein POX_f07401 [Penicillium oxalicum]|uniref:hypothetical protein n=1 Tax=Penicillium oxalicum TaxID=69781 RepID=UPI0020B8894F|nr:hypothetical protein POX_f07401 [Penicillium oxalicum]KAI2787046.1 hypothetical protein POX_f07401 [Penicillium oxalicum]
MKMDDQGILRTVARLDSRALRAEQAYAKLEQKVRSLQESLRLSKEDFDHVTRLLEIFYELNQRTGAVVDYLLRERAAPENEGEPLSIQVMLGTIFKKLGEDEETEQS